MFNHASIRAALSEVPLVTRVVFFDTVGSTNDVARQLASQGAESGALVVADEQRAGRGRQGAQWHTPPGTALASSLLLRFDGVVPAERLALLGGLAAATAIEAVAGLPAAIKWPNDVWVAEHKVGGVLIESAFEGDRMCWAIIGIGINVNGQIDDRGFDYPAATLATLAGRKVDRLALLVAQVGAMSRWLVGLGMPGFIQAVDTRLLWRNRQVSVDDGEQHTVGTLLGLDAEGAIRLQLADGSTRSVATGTLRRA